MTLERPLSPDILNLDFDREIEKIKKAIQSALIKDFKRQGLVVALSGGIDSSTVAALCVQAVGSDRVLGIHMPEKDSSDDTFVLSTTVSDFLGINSVKEIITPVLDAVGCYRRRDEAIREVIPEYDSNAGWKSKIVLPPVTDTKALRFFSIVALSPEGKEIKKRLSSKAYLGIVAATNFKQRTRKMLEYYHADRLNYAVSGTPNRLEYDQGFFVKGGDGLADIKPIAHLYKTQVYGMARYLGLPEEICSRPPTTDTYSMPQSQDEFYFSLPYDKMDLCLYGKNNGYLPEQVAPAVELTPEQVDWVYNDIDQKRRTTRYLQLGPQLIELVCEIQ
jgi:NAD+ synthase